VREEDIAQKTTVFLDPKVLSGVIFTTEIYYRGFWPANMEDKLLVFRCKRGSKEALARIYQKYKRDLLLLATTLLNDSGIAEDVVHDVFVRFVEDVPNFRLTGSLKGYLLTCAANCARNRNRAAAGRASIEVSPEEPASSTSDGPAEVVVCNEQLRQLSAAMTQLPYEQREVVMLHLHAAMTFDTIAESQGISVNTAKSRYRYGLSKLRQIFNHEANK
jgi:RNA polymerase sigma-70 factor (ECF subfamily)